ncbi:MAG: hypothetical protein ACYDD6_00590 [Acidimicrobiales bacterium]
MSGISPVVEIDDYWEWDALARENDWTDGLPVAPPTEDRVQAIIDYLGRDPGETLGLVRPLNGRATVEQVAIQCAMAGCLPEHVPVVVAALDALVDEEFNLEGVQGTTNPCAPLTIACGPQVDRLKINVGEGVFGGGAHANAAIGRAVRLILWNIGGGKPGRTDRSPLGQPAKYAFCVGENSAESPWSSLSTDFGYDAATDSVIVFACQSPYPAVLIGSAQRMLSIIAESLPNTALNAFHAAGQVLVVFSLRPAQVLADAGYSREDVRTWIFENSRFHLGTLRKQGIIESTDPVCNYWGDTSLESKRPPNFDELPDDTFLPLVQSEKDLHLLVTGGRAQWFGAYCPGWGNYGGSAIARPVHPPR